MHVRSGSLQHKHCAHPHPPDPCSPVMFHNPCPTPDHIVTVIHGAEARAPDDARRDQLRPVARLPAWPPPLLGARALQTCNITRSSSLCQPARAWCGISSSDTCAQPHPHSHLSHARLVCQHPPNSPRSAGSRAKLHSSQAAERSKSAASVLSSLSPRKILSSPSVYHQPPAGGHTR